LRLRCALKPEAIGDYNRHTSEFALRLGRSAAVWRPKVTALAATAAGSKAERPPRRHASMSQLFSAAPSSSTLFFATPAASFFGGFATPAFSFFEAYSLQNLTKTQKWRGLNFWSLLPGSNGVKARFGLRLALRLDGWRAEKKNRVYDADDLPRQLFNRARPPTRMSDVFGASGFWANKRAQ